MTEHKSKVTKAKRKVPIFAKRADGSYAIFPREKLIRVYDGRIGFTLGQMLDDPILNAFVEDNPHLFDQVFSGVALKEQNIVPPDTVSKREHWALSRIMRPSPEMRATRVKRAKKRRTV